MRASDAEHFVDDGDGGRDRFRQWQDVPAKEIGQLPDCVFAARRTQVDCRTAIHNGSRKRAAPRVAALGALGLRKEIIDCVDERVVAGRQAPRCDAQSQSCDHGDDGDCNYSGPHSAPSRPGHSRETHECERHDTGSHQCNGRTTKRRRYVGRLEAFPHRRKHDQHQCKAKRRPETKKD